MPIQMAISEMYRHRRTNGKLNTTTRAHNLDRTVINEQKGHSVSQSVKNLVNEAP